jgi:hypothetical protein
MEADTFQGHFEAIIGMSYHLHGNDKPPFFDQLINAHVLERNLFSFFLSMNSNSSESEITLGYINH